MSSSSEHRRSRVLRSASHASPTSLLSAELHDAHDELAMSTAVAEARQAAFVSGFDEGRSAGYAAGVEAAGADAARADAHHATAVTNAIAAVEAAAVAWQQRELTALTAVEDAIVAGALAVAEAVLGRELAVAADPGADAIARALRLVPHAEEVVARLNPVDVERLGEIDPRVAIVPDPDIPSGDCVIAAGATTVDAQLASAVERVREALGG